MVCVPGERDKIHVGPTHEPTIGKAGLLARFGNPEQIFGQPDGKVTQVASLLEMIF